MERQIPHLETNHSDQLHGDEFVAQYAAVSALVEETIELGHDQMTDLFTTRLRDLERENPVAYFRYRNKEKLALIGTDVPSTLIAAIERCTSISEDPAYLNKVFAELSFQRIKENIPDDWDATEYMDNDEAKLYSEFVADLIIARLKDI